MESCWYVKDFADGWIKFYDPMSAMDYAEDTGAIMKWSENGTEPLLVDKWISVRERLPEYMETCIIHCTIGYVTMAQFGGGSKGKEVFVINEEWLIADYWMPLPEPPKK